MINIIKQEISFEDSLKKRLEFICQFCKTKAIFINGSIRKIDKTNLAYVEPHKVIIGDKLYLFFNEQKHFYIGNLKNKIPLSELSEYIARH